MKRYTSLAMKVLKVLGVTAGTVGLLAVAVTVPNLLAAIGGFAGPDRHRKIRRAMTYLKDRGYVKIEGYEGESIRMRLTRNGKGILKRISTQELRLPREPMWDKKWRLIIFDVPNKKSKQRQAFAMHLKNLGSRMAQKSVWIYPYPCHDEIMMLRKLYDIEQCVTYCETSFVKDDERWRDYFDL